MATVQQLEEGIRRADKAGDAEAVRVLGAQLLAMRKPRNKPVRNLSDATVNTAAGITQGVFGLPDIIYKGVDAIGQLGGYVVSKGHDTVASAMGADDWVDRVQRGRVRLGMSKDGIRTPVGVGDLIEKLAPTPSDGAGKFVRLASQFTGGAVSVPGVTTLPKAMMPKVPVRTLPQAMTQGQQVAAAAERQGVRVLPADVGGAMTQRVTAAAAQTPLGAGPIVKGAQEATESAKAAAARMANMAGRVLDPEDAGDLVQKGAKAYVSKTSRAGGRLYDRAENLAKGAMVEPAMARSSIIMHLDELEATPKTNATAIKIMNDLADDLSKPLSVNAIRRLRTSTRTAIMKEGLRGSDLERRVGDVIDNASADIVSSMPKPAAAAYKTADAFWRNRVSQIDDILAPVIGKKGERGGQASFRAIERMAQTGDAKKLSGLLKALPDEDAGAVTATIIDRLGRASPGAQDAVGGVFSPSSFLTNWNKLSPKAKNALFTPELRSALNDLATVTGGMKAASRYANSSNTGGAVGALATGGVLTQSLTSPISTMAFLGTQYGAGKLMASPAFVKWLVRANRNPGKMADHVKQLSVLAAKNPTIAKEVSAFEQSLLNGVNDNMIRTGSAAASPDGGPDQQ